MNMASEYINKGLRISKIADILHIPGSSFYRNNGASEKTSNIGDLRSQAGRMAMGP